MSDNQSAAEVPTTAVAAPPSEQAPASSGGGGLLAVIERLATNPNVNVDVIERLLAQRRAEEDRIAERAFNSALSMAKGEVGPILKKHEVDFTTQKGRTRYKFEELFDIAQVVDPVFARFGLSYRFAVRQDGSKVFVAPILSHADGYSKQMEWLEGTVDPGGTNMNFFQALGSATTYLQRIGLRAAVGLAAGRDDDARSLSAGSPRIDKAQADEMRALLDATGRSAVMMLRLYGADEIEDLTVDQWTRAKEVLGVAKSERKRDA